MKVIGIKGNYKNDSQEKPSVYLMADSSLLKDGKPLFLPEFAEEFIARPALVVRINRLGKNIAKRFASRYYDAVTVGLCVEARGVKKEAKLHDEASLCNAFDGSAVLGDFRPVERYDINNVDFLLTINDEVVQKGNTSQMYFAVDEIIAYVSRFCTLKTGDLIFTGTPAGAGPATIGTHLKGYIGDDKVLDFHVR